jgi:hypothetical protein
MFSALLRPSKSSNESRDELDRYLATDRETIDDPILWWVERRPMYPLLSRMALDYLTIPGMCSFVDNFSIY